MPTNPSPTIKPYTFAGVPQLSSHDLEIENALLNFLPFALSESELKKKLEDFLAHQFNVKSSIQRERMSETTVAQFVQSIPDSASSLVALIGAQPVDSKAFVWIDAVLASSLIQKTLGADDGFPTEIKELTSIEEGVLQYLILKILAEIYHLYEDSTPLHFRLESLIQSKKGLNPYQKDETPTVILKYRVQVGKTIGFVVLALPHPFVETHFLSQDPTTQPLRPQSYQEALKKIDRMAYAKSQLWIELGMVSLTVSEKNQLEKGDVILLDETHSEWSDGKLAGNVLVRVGEGKEGGFLAQLVSSEAPLVVKILDYYGGG